MIPAYNSSQDIQVLQDSITALNAIVDQSVTNQLRIEQDYQSLELKYWAALGYNKKLDDQLRQVNCELADKNREIADLKQQLQQEKDKTASLISQLDHMQSQNFNLRALLEHQTRLIRDLHERLKDSAEKMRTMSQELGRLRRIALIEDARTELKKLEDSNHNRDFSPTEILSFLGLTFKEWGKAPFTEHCVQRAMQSAYHNVYPNYEKAHKLREFIEAAAQAERT